ncbi:MAG: hypothetical protein OXU45_01840 [Candidatus Melainabacteria bacterium]|nr:hypothetical protein [Candidatus Melainabacteria bacterium]
MTIKLPLQINLADSIFKLIGKAERQNEKFAQHRARINQQDDGYWKGAAKALQRALALANPPELHKKFDRTAVSGMMNRYSARQLIEKVKDGAQEKIEALYTVMQSQAKLVMEFFTALLVQAQDLGIVGAEQGQFAIRKDDHDLLFKKEGNTEYYRFEDKGFSEGIEIKHTHSDDQVDELEVRRYSPQEAYGDIIYKEGHQGQSLEAANERQKRWLLGVMEDGGDDLESSTDSFVIS